MLSTLEYIIGGSNTIMKIGSNMLLIVIPTALIWNSQRISPDRIPKVNVKIED